MNILTIIDNKKKKKELSREEIDFFVKGVVDESIKDYQISALLMAICMAGMTKRETVDLTLAMANSGDKLDYAKLGLHNTMDKHSTGGVGDTASLALIPCLMALGYKVGKMSGRGLGLTGGTLDKLESIDGMNVNIGMDKFIEQVNNIGGAIIGQTMELCPADKKLYALRDATSTVDSIPLIASSIMSKKIAGGAQNIVIDVKCGKGAFMKSLDKAVELGDMMVEIGKGSGVNVSYIVTNMSTPLGDYIGNALEVFGAVEVLDGYHNPLYDAVCALGAKLLHSVGVADGKAMIAKVLDDGSAKQKFIELISAQGGNVELIRDPFKLLTSNCKMDVFATKDGYIQEINAEEIAQAVFNMGGGRINKESVIDMSVGVHLLKRVGDKVYEGDPIASLYYNKYGDVVEAQRVQSAYVIGDKIVKYKLIIKE